MNELSLFTGIGGGLLGTKLLGWRHIGYVEIDEYCQRILQQRIEDGYLDDAPIFGDIREFNRTYTGEFKGICDIITAGFPCQPFSVAGKRQGADDERNMWPATIECIRKVRPRYALLENVPGLLTSGYFGTILRDLAESGYDIRWRCLSAAEVGANHKRNRLFIVAESTEFRNRTWGKGIETQVRQGNSSVESNNGSNDVADTGGSRDIGRCDRSRHQEGARTSCEAERCNWWSVEPDVGRLAYGIPNRVDRLRAIGNAQVPAVVKAVWELLNET